MMKFLIINFGSKCDVIFSTPIIENIRAIFDDAQIDFFVCSDNKSILESHIHVHEVLSIERAKIECKRFMGKFITDLSLAYKIRQNKYDTIFVLSESERNARVVLPSGADVRVGIKPRANIWTRLHAFTDTYELIEAKHLVEVKLDAMRAIGLSIQSKKITLYPSESSVTKVEGLLKKYSIDKFVQLGLLSDESSRSVSDEYIASIIDFIELEKKVKVVIATSGSEYESSRLFSVLAKTKSTPVVFIGSLNNNDMIALSAKATLFVGVHTPTLHIAASQNRPTIALFGQDDTKVFGPWDNDIKDGWYISRAAKQSIGKHTVLQSTKDCVPCGQNGCENSGVSMCLSDIDIKQLKNEIERYI